ncbi:MAG: transketolase [Alphaproteobacteria bacterium]|nr:MAG: transketolase [Alphaproteobacteria bacterium]
MSQQAGSHRGSLHCVTPLAPQAIAPETLEAIRLLDRKVQWLSAWTIHNANNLRDKRDGLKVGGHQASCASVTQIMTALYFSVLRPEDRVAVKPHASPVFHAIQYLLGNQSRDQLENFRAFGGAQSYPSRTKDKDDVDFSTGSVGLGVAMTAFASLTQDYLLAKGWLDEARTGRMIALLGDAELDEGNIYEALIEGTKHDLRNCWWIIDYNRQSLDSVTSDRMFSRFQDIFETAGWQVTTLKYGKQQLAAFEKPGGAALREWIDNCPNSLFSALTFKGGQAWRDRLTKDIGSRRGVKALLDSYDDDQLHALMTNLAGHDLEVLLDAFHGITSERPQCIIAYTIKGHNLPFQGHKDNHAGIMNDAQMAAFRTAMGVAEGREWEPFAGIDQAAERLQAFLDKVPFAARRDRRYRSARFEVPGRDQFPAPKAEEAATQVAFGKIMNDLARMQGDFVDRIVTTSPDVTVSTNLGGWVNQRGIFNRQARDDVFKAENVLSAQRWAMSAQGQHLELGIAENNLFLALAALGLSASLFGERLLPVATLYDPFIARGLDALNYACYQDARFMLVGTPSGITLAPEGGAHQSISTPLIGMGQDKLTYFEPAYVDELAEIMRWGFAHMQAEDGGSVYLRLSTRQIPQARRDNDDWRTGTLNGAYWQVKPEPGAEIAIAYTGVVAPEAWQAFEALREDVPGAGLLAVPSPDVAHRDWKAALDDQAISGQRNRAPIEELLGLLGPQASLVTVIDGSPHALSWLGGVRGHRVVPIGVDRFGQSGDVPALYEAYRLNADAILDACAVALLRR